MCLWEVGSVLFVGPTAGCCFSYLLSGSLYCFDELGVLRGMNTRVRFSILTDVTRCEKEPLGPARPGKGSLGKSGSGWSLSFLPSHRDVGLTLLEQGSAVAPFSVSGVFLFRPTGELLRPSCCSFPVCRSERSCVGLPASARA